MSEILRELQEDLRNERLQKFWHSFGRLIIGLSIVIVLSTATVVIWDNLRRSKAVEMTSRLIQGTDRIRVEDYQGAVEAFAAVESKGSGAYAVMALMKKAAAQEAMGDREGARKTYAEAGRSSSAGALADLATLLAAEAPPPAQSPFIHSHTEQNAWRLLKEGKKEEAMQLFLSLRDNGEAPGSLRRRAAIVLDYLATADGHAG